MNFCKFWIWSLALILVSGVLPAVAAVAAVQEPPAYAEVTQLAWQEHTHEALTRIDRYISMHPDDTKAKIERIRILSWRGEYSAALHGLEVIDINDTETQALRARILAWAHKRDAALAVNQPLYVSHPRDYGDAWTQALILSQSRWPQQALAPLARARAIKSDTPDALLLDRIVRLPLFSWIDARQTLYSDSSDIVIHGSQAAADLRLGDRVRLEANLELRRFSAPAGSIFAPLTGSGTSTENRAEVGLIYAATPDTQAGLQLGSSRVDRLGSSVIGQAFLDQYLNDNLSWSLQFARDRVAVSPRSLGVMSGRTTIGAHWTPNLDDSIDTTLSYDNFSDGNRRSSILAIYRHKTYSSERAIIDLGVIAEAQHNSMDTNNGYYSPSFYRRVEPMASGYFNLHPGVGLYVSAALGVQRDDTFRQWKRAADFNAELTMGIYGHWQLVGWAAWSQRLNQLGRYQGSSFGLRLRYRFCNFDVARCPSVP